MSTAREVFVSSKIIKSGEWSHCTPFEMREFSAVERGEKAYRLRSFADDEEFAIQDAFLAADAAEPETIKNVEDEITDEDYLPPSKLAKAENGLVGEKVEMPAASGDVFVESSVFSDVSELTEDYPTKVVKPPSESAFEASEEYKNRVVSLESRSMELEAENARLAEAADKLKAEAEDYKKRLDELEIAVPDRIREAEENARKAGYEEGSTEFSKKYEAEKADYAVKLEDFNKKSLEKLEEISVSVRAVDEQMAEIVLGFVKSVVGAERKINDGFVVNVIKNNLKRLKEYRNISFSVNPEDENVVREAFPDYQVSSDISIDKGCVLINSKSGEIFLDPDAMIADLERRINEEFAVTKND